MPQRIYDVAALDDLGTAGMRQIEVEGSKILLIRDSDTVSAIGATCPHAGGPLAEGLLHGRRVICPWHKAAFCARTVWCFPHPRSILFRASMSVSRARGLWWRFRRLRRRAQRRRTMSGAS